MELDLHRLGVERRFFLIAEMICSSGIVPYGRRGVTAASAICSILMFAERYQNLGKLKYAYAIPNPNGTTESDRWQHISQALLSAVATGILPDPVIIYGRLISAYRSGDVDGFNQVIREYREYLERAIPQEVKRSQLEFFFNQAQPFLQAMALYFIVFLFALVSWLKWPKTLGKTAVILLLFAFLLHTAGLATRMYLQGGRWSPTCTARRFLLGGERFCSACFWNASIGTELAACALLRSVL